MKTNKPSLLALDKILTKMSDTELKAFKKSIEYIEKNDISFADYLSPFPMKKERFFIVNYIAGSGSGSRYGRVDCKIPNGKYINAEELQNKIKSKNNFDNVVITNILELTEEDYETFISET